MASTGAYIIVAAGCSAFGFAVGVAGDLLRQRLLAKNKVLTHQVPDVEGNLQASFLEQPATEEEIRSRSSTSLRFAVGKAGLEDSMTSTMASVTHAIADALPYGAGEGAESPCDALQAGALRCVAVEDESFAPDLSQCLPGCLDPVRGLHHAKCPNHESRLASRQAPKAQVVEASQEPLATDCIGQTGAVPYCESLARMAVPYGPPTLKSAEEA